MDMNKLLKSINTLKEYISASSDVSGENKNTKVQFNMSTVLALKKIRSYEIEYFNKYEENGIACAVLQYMVDLAPSKTWGVLGKEIVNLIQYWLNAIRKHLISHSTNWWMFLRLLLNFIKEVRQKDSSLPNLLVELTAECLLDLASNDRADVFHKYEILHCLNMYCSEANREIRFALRNKLGEYFTKLSTYMATCGHLPCQLSIMEMLLRWLVPRHDQILRSSSAEKWFPTALYPREAVDVFLSRPWMDFFQDARDFLNIHNQASSLVVSVICRRLSIGNIDVIPGKDRNKSWLDINSNSKCLSMVLDPQMLETFGATNSKTWETLLICEDNTHTAKLDKDLHQLTLSVTTIRPSHAHPSLVKITNDAAKDVKIVISSKSDLTELDKALSGVFGTKYQTLINLDSQVTQSSSQHTDAVHNNSHSEEDVKFSHPVAVRRGRRSGYVVRSVNPWKSPSTTSTTSLAQLHDRLAALPTYKFDKEAERVCASPKLSKITELSEPDDRHSFHSATTQQFCRPYGVCYRGRKTDNSKASVPRFETNKSNRGLSPVIDSKTDPSCLLVATIASTDDSVISDTMERLAKNKDFQSDNIIDLLVKEALEANPQDPSDSGINTDDNRKSGQKGNCDAIANTPYADNLADVTRKRGSTIVRESTSDESNTEIINATPLNYVNTRRNKNIRKKTNEGCFEEMKSNVYDAQAIEDFFSEHIAKNSAGDTVVSPTLAKKINEISSESSENFEEHFIDELLENPEVDKSDIIDCLNCIVDKVCVNLDKYTGNTNVDKENSTAISNINEPLKTAMGGAENLRQDSQKSDPEQTKSIKLKYKFQPKSEKAITKSVKRKRKNTANKQENEVVEEVIVQPEDKKETKAVNKRTITKVKKIIKQKTPRNEITLLDNTNVDTITDKGNVQDKNKRQEKNENKPDLITDLELDTSLIRRKRKLYSPKDQRINDERLPLHNTEIVDDGYDDIELKKSKVTTPKPSTTFYKEIETERKRYTRKSRTRKSKVPEAPSPRTMKMNEAFDKLKGTIDSNEKIILADKTFDIDVYNFTSDSEEELFKKKKTPIRKKTSTTTMCSFESAISTRRGRVTKKVNYTENMSSNEDSNRVSKRKQIVKKKKPNKRKVSVEPLIDLEDERMRQAPPEILNTSIIIDNPKEPIGKEIEPVLTRVPELESIVDAAQTTKELEEINKSLSKSVKRHKKIELSLKKGKTSKTNSDDITIKEDSIGSPLPGLMVESVLACVDDNNDSVTATMVQKFKKMYQDGFDAYINETNTTQNLLSDIERVNYSPENTRTSEIQENNIRRDKRSESEIVHFKKQVAITKKLKGKTRTKPDVSNNVLPIKSVYVNDVINITGRNNESETSIATQGINAHGDMDESPPSISMIEQQVQPRNLELEDLEQSMQTFFNNLRNHIATNNAASEKLDTSDNENNKKYSYKEKAKVKSKSARVVVARLSAEEIDKWLTSDKSDSVKTSQKSEKQSKQRKTCAVEREMSPVVSVTRLSSHEMEKWLPSCNNSVSEQDSVRVPNKSKERKGLHTLYEAHNWLPSRRNSSSDDESEHNKQNYTEKSMFQRILKRREPLREITKNSTNKESTQKDKSRAKLKLLYYNNDNLNRQKENDADNDDRNTNKDNNFDEHTSKVHGEVSDATQKRNSVISPIKIGNFMPQSKKSNPQSDDDEYVKRVRSIFTDCERNFSARNKIKESTQNHLDVLSSPDSTSTKINSSADLKKTTPAVVETKKQKIDHSVTVSESGPSTSSVTDWFRRNEPSCSRDEIALLSVTSCVQNVMEKLDTTLVDMNQNTSEQFMLMFVDAKKQLDENRERHREMYKKAASDMLAQIVHMMDETFSDLARRSQEMDESFMEQLKSRASQMILADSKKKQAMVQILKEDVQAVVEYVKRKQL